MYKRKKKPRVKARVVKRKVKRVAKRRAPMAKKKSSWDKTENEDQSDEFETEEGSEQTTDQHNEGEADQAGQLLAEAGIRRGRELHEVDVRLHAAQHYANAGPDTEREIAGPGYPWTDKKCLSEVSLENLAS